MRFFLDEGVDAECRAVLTDAGHEAWTVGEARRSGADNTDQVIYAHDKDAVLVIDDKQLAASRQSMPIGRIVDLRARSIRPPSSSATHLTSSCRCLCTTRTS